MQDLIEKVLLINSAKTKKMTYDCIPTWMKDKPKDHFDYPLRSKQEIQLENEISPPNFPVNCIKKTYMAPLKNIGAKINNSDLRNSIVKFEVEFNNLRLTPLQKNRLIFLLGNRYKGGKSFKIVVRQYDNLENNFAKGLDILKQLYYETKRAPPFLWERMTNKERRKAKRKYLGKTVEEQNENLKKYLEMYNADKEKFDNLMKDPTNFTKEKCLERWTEKYKAALNAFVSKEKQEKEMEETQKSLVTKDEYFKNLVNERILSPKAYKTFYENPLNNSK
jgi:hypothetical protein